MSGWRAGGIVDTIEMGSEGLPSLDPFLEIDPSCDSYDIDTQEGNFDDNPNEFIEDANKELSDSGSEWELRSGWKRIRFI